MYVFLVEIIKAHVIYTFKYLSLPDIPVSLVVGGALEFIYPARYRDSTLAKPSEGYSPWNKH